MWKRNLFSAFVVCAFFAQLGEMHAQCTAELACNYDPSATVDDGSCAFSDATEFDIMDGFFLGFYDAESGCPDQVDLAGDLFYPVQLTENGYMFDVDEGLLGYLQFVLGPDLGQAFYNESVNNTFSVCDNQLNVTNSPLLGSFATPWTSPTFSIDFLGFNLYWYPASLATAACNDEAACNYDDTPCIVPDATLCEYAVAGFDCDGNPVGSLTCDAGEALVALNYDGADGWASEFSFVLADADGNVLGEGASAGYFEFCVPADVCIVVTLNDSYGDGQSGGDFAPDGTTTVFYDGEVVDSVTGNWGSSATILAGNCAATAGCMDALACNYDATASEDDGSCVYFDTDIFALGEVMHTTTFAPNDACPGGLALANSYGFPVVGTPDAPIGFTITPEQAASLIENLGSLGELFAYEVANAAMSFCGTTITADLQIAPDFSSEWSGDYYSFTSLNTFGVPSSIAGAGCNDPVACNYEPCAGPDPSLCTYPEEGLDCDGNAAGCGEDEDQLTIAYDGLDGFPGEFSFTVTDASGMEWGSGSGAGTFDICIPAGTCATVTMQDSFGDGHLGGTDGTTTIALNGEVVESISGNWGNATIAVVGNCEPACSDNEAALEILYDGADGYSGEFSFVVLDANGNALQSGGDMGFFQFCVPNDECLVVQLEDAYSDGHFGGEFGVDGTTTISYNGEVVETLTGNWGSSATILVGMCTETAGCMDALACNYDATASEDDGSCVYFDTDIFALGEVMHTTTFAPNDACPGGLALANSYGFPVVGTPDAPIGFTITPEQAASLIENLGSLGELFAYEVANVSMSFCGTSITADLQIAPDFTSEWSGDYYPFTSLNTFGVPSSIAGAGCNDPVACNYEPCAGPDPSLCTYPEEGLDCDGNALGCGDDEDQLTVSYDGLDGYPSEFTFTVVDDSGMELGSGAGAGTFDICIPAGACVTVMLMDDYGDGQYGWGASDGTTTISLNGELVETFTGNWGSFASAPVGECGLQCDEGQVGLEIFYDGADGYPEEFSFTVIDANGNELASGSDMGLFQFCVPNEACLIVLLEDSYGDGHQGYSGDPSGVTDISLNGELVESVAGNWGSSYAVAIGDCAAVAGCMNPESCNFDPDALIDDGSCLSLDICGVCGGPGLPDVFALDAVAILDEASMGDFSNDALNPTVVAFAGEGAYVLSGDAANFQAANADIEYFSMTVPAGYVISGVRMLAFDQTGYEPAGSPAGNGGFLGVGTGSTLPVIASPEDFVVAANALDGGALVGVMGGTTVGFGLLDDLAQPFAFPEYGINIAGISGSLTAGTYTFMFKEGNSHPETANASVHWSFAIEVSATSTNHYMTIVDCDGCLNDADGDGVCDELEVAGCTDMSSCNYNPMATDDDGSCGDTPEAASLCGEGTEWSNETCGCVALPDNCPSDIDGDGITSTTDLLLLLQNFATACQD